MISNYYFKEDDCMKAGDLDICKNIINCLPVCRKCMALNNFDIQSANLVPILNDQYSALLSTTLLFRNISSYQSIKSEETKNIKEQIEKMEAKNIALQLDNSALSKKVELLEQENIALKVKPDKKRKSYKTVTVISNFVPSSSDYTHQSFLNIRKGDKIVVTSVYNDILTAYFENDVTKEEKLVDIEKTDFNSENIDLDEFNDIINEERNDIYEFSHDNIEVFGKWQQIEINRISKKYETRFVGKRFILTKISGAIWEKLKNVLSIDKELDSSRYLKKMKFEDTYKTKMCKFIDCQSQTCTYAHSHSELRCAYHFNGNKCKFGDKCCHSHV